MLIDRRFAERIKKVSPSSTLAITSKAKKLKAEGKDVVNFAAGEPDFDTPDFIKEAAIQAIKQGFTKYTPSTGTPELKNLIREKFKKENGLDYALDQVVVSCGAKHSIFNALIILVDRDNEVLIPSPYWVSYPEMVKLCEGKTRFLKTTPENNFKITPQDLKRNINEKTKILILNSPSNPSGAVYTREELKELAAICVENKVFVVSDEIYERIIFDGLQHISIASLGKDICDLTITVNGLSKAYSMTGWRIGYLGGPPDIVQAISRLQDHSTSNPVSISQKAAVAALKTDSDFSIKARQEFQKRRDYLVSRLKTCKNLDYVLPGGAFYIFCGIKKTGMDSFALASRLLDEELIALIPGNSFGRDDYVRISFATNLSQIEKGMDRIKHWLEKQG
jgi:aspartate aminotransferase